MDAFRLWLRWSWRDLRARWIQVAVISLIIALGTGTFAGLSSVVEWRENSADRSYEALEMFDLRVRTAQAATLSNGAMKAAVVDLEGVRRAEERLVLPIQVDASYGDETILVPGQLVGVDVRDGGPFVNQLSVAEGRGLEAGDAGESVASLEGNFAGHYDLPPEGVIRTSGGAELAYVGHALTPEYFIVTTERGGFLAEANFAVVFTSLETAAAVAGVEPGSNDLVLTFDDGANADAVRQRVEEALVTQFPGAGFTFTPRAEDAAYELIYGDIDGDRRLQRVFAILILVGAAAAAFNLITRIVDSQRREIGIAMALGVPRSRIAIRPLLVGLQVALLGVVFGVIVGIALSAMMASVVQEFFPLPVWETGFRFDQFFVAALLGFLLPFVATLIPVWFAVRVSPIRALQSGYRAARTGGLAPLLRKLPLPGNTIVRMPVRDLVRSPRRSFLTGFGIMAAITIFVAIAGVIDSMASTSEAGERELLRSSPDRLDVDLAGFYAADGAEIEQLRSLTSVDAVEPALRLNALAREGDVEVGLRLELIDLDNAVWIPTIRDAVEADGPGIYLAESAAAALGVGPGDSISLQHPRLASDGSVGLVASPVTVAGVHPHPFRFVSYMDSAAADLMGMAGLANFAWAVPGAGFDEDDVRRDLFGIPQVVSAQPSRTIVTAFQEILDEFVVLIRIVEGVILFLAVLVAFNSASINADERRREHATMFAFGVPVRTAMLGAVVENALLGLGATLAGIVAGWLVLRWMVDYLLADTMPDLALPSSLEPATVLLALVLGVLAVALAPLLTYRKVRNMDIASTLKFTE